MRHTPPNRRNSRTVTVQWQGHIFDVTYGLDDAGRIVDVFGDCRKSGQMQADIRASATLASLAIQHGADLTTLLRPLDKVQDYTGAEFYASPIGEIIAQIIRHAADEFAAIKEVQG